ncbi:Gamma-aminobutyric acid receptor subunit beta [Araneus ventricosus]|uniref:Gamma-aminobutyric acid receptor subunit beta n=1 Tax=Araneus ventricosus TaxID=182803 RepID=A0A4Y2ADF0_ARAVE|nr:Gamma-aminobutyric acid receptor subunit beta [Araneus ventricosus]
MLRLTVTAGCPMDLQYFPMDRQVCFLEIESFGYTMRDIRYKWGDGEKSIGMSTDVELPQFKVLGHRQDQKEEHLSTGNYSRLVCEIQFVRSMGYYLIQIYIPAGLIVIISWVSFWLHRNATPARVALGVTTVLTMTTLMSSTNSALPKISYVKSIDVYLGTCFVMVFASLLEYATVGYLGKRISMRKARNQQMAKMAQEHRQRCVAAAAAAEGPERCPPPEAVLLPGNAEVTMVKSAVRGQPVSSFSHFIDIQH